MKIEFHPAAAAELRAAVDYYEEALPGLGRRFRHAVQATTERALKYPESDRARPMGVRRLTVAGFPYDVVYRVRGKVLLVLAIAHQRRRPGYWQPRGV